MPAPIDQQISPSLPAPDGYVQSTNLIVPDVSLRDRLAHFDEQVFDLRLSSHLSRLMSVLLGDAGMGQFRKAWLLRRLAATLSGSHFFDLDRFYGALFGIQRIDSEILAIDPNDALATSQEWSQAILADTSYRSRLEAFAKAISYGATTVGMELLAEAILSVDCDVVESYTYADRPVATYGSLEVNTYGVLEGFTYGDLEGTDLPDSTGQLRRNEFIIVPHRPITLGEEWDLRRVLEVFKPADTILRVESGGLGLYDSITPRGYAADSEYWEIVQSRDNVEVPRPAFSAYQGESWSYIPDVVVILATAEHEGGETEVNIYERIAWKGSRAIEYMPQYSMLTPDQILGKRAAIGAVLNKDLKVGGSRPSLPASFVYGIPATSTADPTESLYIDRVPVSSVSALTGGGQIPNNERLFWSTPQRAGDDGTVESIEYRLGQAQRVRYLSFEVPKFPHSLVVQAWSSDRSTWEDVYSLDTTESFPEQIANTTPPLVHPQHGVNGHWRAVSATIDPVTTDRWRIRMVRINTGLPLNRLGEQVPYSLGLRNFDLGYQVLSKDDVFCTPGSTLASAPDLFGGRTTYSLFTEPASNIAQPGVVWKSEPQPVANAVVNLYVDLRTDDESAQVVERWYLEPLHSGPLFHLYWSNDTPTGDFTPSRDVLGPPAVRASGNAVVRDGSIFMDPAASAFVEVQNSAIHFDPSLKWTFGINFYPMVNQAEADQIIADLGFLQIHMTPAGFQVNVGDAPAISVPMDYHRGQSITLMVSRDPHDGTSGTTMVWAQGIGDPVTVEQDWTPSPVEASRMRLGGSLGADRLRGGYLLNHLYLRSGRADGDDEFEAFAADPMGFVTDASLRPDINDTTVNMVLRRSTSYVSDANPLGFIGGPGNIYEDLSWTPVERDFTLQKGYIQVPPIAAKFWKFEFSNLVPEVYPSFGPIVRQVKVIDRIVDHDGTKQAYQQGWPSLESQRALAQRMFFADTVISQPTNDARATSALHNPNAPEDPLSKFGWVWRWKEWQGGDRKAIYQVAQRHTYQVIEMVHSDNLAFFVGLNALVPSRINYLTDNDTSAYVDRFYDNHNVATSVWELDPNDYSTPSDASPINGMEMVSKIFSSLRRVEALQFATVQTHNIQLLPNDDFSDPASATNRWLDPNDWHTLGDATLTWLDTEYAVMLNRHPVPIALGEDESDLPHSPVHTLELRKDLPTEAGLGGIASGYVPIAPKGMVHAAVRFTAMVDLSEPYTLEIVARNDAVIASVDITAKAGETVERWVSYPIGSYPFPSTATSYARRSIIAEPDHAVDIEGGPTVVSGDPDPLAQDALVQVRLVQHAGTRNDQIKISRLSLFEDAIVWEFSVDGCETWNSVLERVKDNPDGVIRFATPGTGLAWRATSYRPNVHLHSIQIRPWYEGKVVKRAPVPQRGANLSAFDHEPPVQDDPEFRQWFEPIPLWWFRDQQRLSMLPPELASTPTSTSHFYARTILEALAPATSDFTTQVQYQRVMWHVLDDDGFIVPGDSYPTTEHITIAGTYGRAIGDSHPTTGTMSAIITPFRPSLIIDTPDHNVTP